MFSLIPFSLCLCTQVCKLRATNATLTVSLVEAQTSLGAMTSEVASLQTQLAAAETQQERITGKHARVFKVEIVYVC